jgi:hypothetical protein
MARRSAAPRNGLARLPSSALEAELRRRERAVRTLGRRRDRLASKLDALDHKIAMLGGAGRRGRGGGRGGRARNEMTLADALNKVLSGRTMSVTDAADAVQRAGYRTNSRNFRTQVNLALIKSGFKRVGRGQYTAR